MAHRLAVAVRRPAPRAPPSVARLWGFKYDSQYAGTGLHADEAAVNVTFWITPDEADLDPSGGLIVHSSEAPRGWGFRRFDVDAPEIRRYLESVGGASIRVPYGITTLYGTRDR